jgi:dipeptidyl aminopeptidase/acylaminoacyl peptidase
VKSEPFIPHTQAHLIEARVFPSPLPDAVYDKLIKDYHELNDVAVSRITYESDGLAVTGVSVMPAKLEGAHPILIYNRGGSREYGKLTLYTIMRSLVPFARKGYMVFASNYRGNDGGEGQEEFGGRDIHDVLNLLTIARNHPNFDGLNAFMIGHSRGGMMTTLAIKHGAKMNAAISIAGIADARKMMGHESVRENMLKKHVPGYHENPMKVLEDRSALVWPDAVSVPLLLLHGDNDKDIDVSDSINLHQAIQSVGGTSELVIYPSGSHALVRSWEDVMARSFAWVERYRQ